MKTRDHLEISVLRSDLFSHSFILLFATSLIYCTSLDQSLGLEYAMVTMMFGILLLHVNLVDVLYLSTQECTDVNSRF